MKIDTFSNKVKQSIIDSQNGFCAERDCISKIHSIHHKLPNTKANRNRFPLFIHSPMNAAGLCAGCHANKPGRHRIAEKQAEMYEGYLQELKQKGAENGINQ